MLEFLRIHNLALIEDLELEFAAGLNVLTGETGAGKSFVMRALGFLLGDRLEADMVRPGRDRAVVEALFHEEGPDGGELVIRRELVAATGRSRLFVNDSLSSQEAVRDLRSRLVWHTSQHGQQRLLSPAYQGRMLDAFLPDRGLLERRDALLAELREVAARRGELDARVRSLQERREFLEYQGREIEKVDPQPGEEAELLERKRAFRDEEHVRRCIDGALDALHGEGGLLERAGALAREVLALAAVDPGYAEEAEALEDFRQRLLELDGRLRREEREAGGGFDAEAVEARLFELSRLRRKLGRSLEEIIDFRAEIAENLSFLDSCALDMKGLDRREAELARALGEVLAALGAARREAGRELAGALAAELRGLGFAQEVGVAFEFAPVEVHPGLAEDRARMMWTPNPGQAPQPLDRIASGGELSRFLLALVGLLTREAMPTLLFDEVDAGIGGLTLTSVGRRVAALAARQQVILITHWPQLAALAGRHFMVRKEVADGATSVRCVPLAGQEVFDELARMAGGGAQGQALARELLAG